MYEAVSKFHPDKVADRIAGAIVDIAYCLEDDPKVAIEVLIGHGVCHIINESSVKFSPEAIDNIVKRIAGPNIKTDYVEVPQDDKLAHNQARGHRCGDNGIFLGKPVTAEQKELLEIAKDLEIEFPSDGKYILDKKQRKLIVCQSQASANDLVNVLAASTKDKNYKSIVFNPLGYWTGGTDVDCGATNRKLGSDMGDSISGGGLHGKDLSKADVSVNIYCWLLAQKTKKTVVGTCAIGDKAVNINGKNVPFDAIIKEAKNYIKKIGGFEKFAEYGLLRP